VQVEDSQFEVLVVSIAIEMFSQQYLVSVSLFADAQHERSHDAYGLFSLSQAYLFTLVRCYFLSYYEGQPGDMLDAFESCSNV
jgi:hypothetical protein